MDSVRQRHYASFKENLAIIAEGISEGTDLRTTPLVVTLPLELDHLLAILREGGLDLGLTATGLQAAVGFYTLYEQREADIQATFQRILADKRATMRYDGSRVLTADQLWRSFEFFNEAARTIQIISTQRELDSPAQHPHPTVGDISASVGPVRRG